MQFLWRNESSLVTTDGKTSQQLTPLIAVGSKFHCQHYLSRGWTVVCVCRCPEVPYDPRVISIPLIDGTGNSAATISEAITAVVTELKASRPVFVCCRSGANRSPSILSAALFVAGLFDSPETAVKQMAGVRQEINSLGSFAEIAAVARDMKGLKSIRIGFTSHGLGDCVHAATALRLYVAAGHDVAIQVEANKRWVWQAAGIPIYDGPDTLPHHPYHYLPSQAAFFDLNLPDHSSSKIAGFFDIKELPALGTKEQVWQKICNERVDAGHAVSESAQQSAAAFLAGLPKPIVLLHSKGTNWQSEKSISDGTAFALICELVNSGKSVVTLDWDGRAPTLGHERVRSIRPCDRRTDTEFFAALCMLSDLLIGIDSGPFHLAQWTGIQSLFVTHQIPPVRCCIPSPNSIYMVPAKDRQNYQNRDQSVWNFTEFRGDAATHTEIAVVATQMLNSRNLEESNAMNQDTIPGTYTYRRCGYDEREMILLPNGEIGKGAAGCERTWRLVPMPLDSQALVICGDGGRETCYLQPCKDGVLRGPWLHHERMPIELTRKSPPQPVTPTIGGSTYADFVDVDSHDEPQVNLWNGQLRQWSPTEAVELFPAYDPAWNLPVATRGNGLVWLIDPAIERSDLDASAQDHEGWLYPYLQLKPGQVYLDLASFVGTYAIWNAQQGAETIAVEPMPRHFELLKKNIQLNGGIGDNIRIINKAFGGYCGTAWMQSNLHYASCIGTVGDVQVPVTTLDAEFDTLRRLDLIKLDVEGAECEVIAGGMETIRRLCPRLIIEVHSHMPGREENGNILAEQLTKLGYSWRAIWSNSPAYYYIEATPN